MHVVKSSRIFVVLFASALAACSGGGSAPAARGDVSINVSAVMTSPPQTVLVRLYGPPTLQPGAPGYIDTVIAAQAVVGSGTFTATFPSVPVGTYQVHAKGYDAFDVPPLAYNDPATPPIWESAPADPSVTVTGGGTASTNLFMQELGVQTISNNAPWVSALASDVTSVWSATFGGQSTIANLTATLFDADGDLNGFLWTDDVGGTFGTPSGNLTGGTATVATTWAPPPNYGGLAHLYLEVFDDVFNASRVSLTLTVQQTPGYGAVIVNVAFNNNPIMTSPLVANYILDANNAIIGGGGQIAPGAQTLLTIGAYDPNGDALQFNFTDNCGGTFDAPVVTGAGTSADPYLAAVIYTSNALTPPNTTCTATADVLDLDAASLPKGGELIVNLGIHIGL